MTEINYIDINRRHGNKGRQPKHAFSVEEINKIIGFIQNYAELHAILLPGRIPGLKKYERAMLLPSNTSKREVYNDYVQALGATTQRLSSKTAFFSLWRQYLPHFFRTKPMTDLCWVCQKNSTAIVRTANMPIENQSQVRSAKSKV